MCKNPITESYWWKSSLKMWFIGLDLKQLNYQSRGVLVANWSTTPGHKPRKLAYHNNYCKW